jgi:RHS repeat-associated protein
MKYTYDYENRHTNVDQYGTVTATYTYNALGQRIGIKDSGTQTWTVYNGSSADANPYADFNSSGSVTMRYLDGQAVDELLARTNSSGTTAWYITDKLGSVQEYVGTDGSVLDHVTYDSFGNITSQTNSIYADRIMFAGVEYDSGTGLYYDHARYYDSLVGRIVARDPMGFAGGDTKLDRHVYNGPTDGSDQSGDMIVTRVLITTGMFGPANLPPGQFPPELIPPAPPPSKYPSGPDRADPIRDQFPLLPPLLIPTRPHRHPDPPTDDLPPIQLPERPPADDGPILPGKKPNRWRPVSPIKGTITDLPDAPISPSGPIVA